MFLLIWNTTIYQISAEFKYLTSHCYGCRQCLAKCRKFPVLMPSLNRLFIRNNNKTSVDYSAVQDNKSSVDCLAVSIGREPVRDTVNISLPIIFL